MIRSEAFVEVAAERNLRLFSGVPCSFLKPLINCVIDTDELRYVGAANEGDAVAIAAGSELGGVGGVVMLQNSGLGNAVNPLTSLAHTFRLPLLLVVTLRGDPLAPPDEPQHRLMGRITTGLLELMDIPWEAFPPDEEHLPPALDRALDHMRARRTAYALVLRRGEVEGRELTPRPASPRSPRPAPPTEPFEATTTRRAFLEAVQRSTGPRDVVLATTGHTGRELYACDDRESQLYVVGSMGCASSIGLGLALARPDRRVIVLDGDGALLMRLGALATIGHEGPANLVHVVLDNGRHESTGGQATVSGSIDFPAIAAACGYARSERVRTANDLASSLGDLGDGPLFLHAPVMPRRPGTGPDLPRPEISPDRVARRLEAFLARA